MKEQFRSWKFRGDIRVKYKDANGEEQTWVINQERLLSDIVSIVETYMAGGIRLTNRQLYYQLVGKATIPNALKVYKRVCKFLTDARYGGYIDWKAIEDRGRVPKRHAQWDSVLDLVESAVYSYRLPRWKDRSTM